MLLGCIAFSSFGQQTKLDSLKFEFKKSKVDTTKARILSEIVISATKINFELAKKYNDSLIEFSRGVSKKYLAGGYKLKGIFNLMSGGKLKESLDYYEKSLNLFKSIGDKKSEAKLLIEIGTSYAKFRDNDEAIKYYEESIILNKIINNEKGNINQLVFIAMIKGGQKFDYQIAIKYLIEALDIADKYNSPKKGLVHKQIGSYYLLLGSYLKAEKHLIEALKYAEKQNDLSLLSITHNLFGYLYEDKNSNYEKALYHYKKSLEYSKLFGSKFETISRYHNVGLQHSRLNNHKEAKKYLEEGLFLAKELKIEHEIISSYYFLANYYALINDKFNAIKYLSKANKLNGNNSKIEHKDQFYRLGESFSKNKNYQEAYKNMYMYAILADSLFKKNSVEQISNIETKYQTSKKEKENLQLKADKVKQELLTQKANTRNWLLLFGLVAVGIISFVIWRRYKSEAKAKATILNQKKVIENLQKELHHRVKNNLAIIDTFIEVAKEEFNDDKFDTKLTEIQNRIVSINEIHKQLYQNSDVTNLNIKNYVDILYKNVSQSFINKKITLQNTIENINLNADTSFPVGLIINEFLTNSYKYAFEKEGEIIIEMKDKGQEYILTLSDNGKGLPKGFNIEKTETFGLRIVNLLTKQIDGIFNLESNNGVQLTIQIPKV